MASQEATASSSSHSDEREVDESVLAGCRAGDREAQRQLYDRCASKVYRLMVRMVGQQDAPDVAQQVFLQVFRKIDQFSGLAKFETWLYRLATNEALQHLRKRARKSAQPLIQEPAAQADSGLKRHEHRELLERALGRLDPELRAMFLLREMDGFSYRSIAESLDIPEGTVASRLNRARRELQQHLTELGWEP